MTNENGFATGQSEPFCPGCGHTPLLRALQEALGRHHTPRGVTLVTDIGCIGMADSLFACHTLHGLHGRSPALAAGVALSTRDPAHKVVALMGDGGAAIGLQHILEAARLNVDVTLIVANNQNYGMTGGQGSAYTALGVKTVTTPNGSAVAPFSLVDLVAPLGVFRARLLATDKGLADVLADAAHHRGFALVETMNWCPSYAGKFNPETLVPKAMRAFFESQGLAFGVWPATTTVQPFRFVAAPKSPAPKAIEVGFAHTLDRPVTVVLAGSAGEGVQNAAEAFVGAALRAGLAGIVRGDYPVTVGKGFSAASLRITPEPGATLAGETPDVALVTSLDGLRWAEPRLHGVGRVVYDASLLAAGAGLPCGAETVDFRRFGARQAGFAALVWLLDRARYFPRAALEAAVAAMAAPKARESYEKVLAAFAADASPAA